MRDYNEDFLGTFNEYYPYERYIMKVPHKLTYLFDDCLLTEIFIPSTEITPTVVNGQVFWNNIEKDDVYVKVKGPAGEMRIAYYDFAEHVREEIRNAVPEDFGDCEWESLYVEHEDPQEVKALKDALDKAKERIIEKYGVCNVKPNFKITSTKELI